MKRNQKLSSVCFIVLILSSLFSVRAYSSEILTLETKSFKVDISTGEITHFRLYSKANPEKNLLHNSSKSPLISLKFGLVSTSEKDGFYKIKFKEDRSCKEAILTGAKTLPNKIIFRAKFLDCANRYRLTLTEIDENLINFNVEVSGGEEPSQIVLSYKTSEDEVYSGFGTQVSFLNAKGYRIPIIAQEQGFDRGDGLLTKVLGAASPFVGFNGAGTKTTNHLPVPYYLSSELYALYLTTNDYAVFDLTDKTISRIENFHPRTLDLNIIDNSSPAKLVEKYTEYSGRMSPLPTWTQEGIIVSLHGGRKKVLKKLDTLLKAEVPVKAIWIQDWCGTIKTPLGNRMRWIWNLDDDLYPDFEGMVRELKSQGIRVLTYINPYLKYPGKEGRSERNNLFFEALENNLLINFPGKDNTFVFSSGGFKAAIIDLFNKETRDWVKDTLKNKYLNIGVSGWMADFGETYPILEKGSKVKYSKRFAEHQEFTHIWNKINREVIAENNLENEIVFFSRTGTAKSPGAKSILWLGDQIASWGQNDGIKSSLNGLLTAGISGFSLVHSDIGGYLGLALPIVKVLRSKELLKRWSELNAFTALFRTHEGLPVDKHHQIYSDNDTIKFINKMTKLYSFLAPYRKELMKEAKLKGYPLVRPLFFHFPKDKKAWSVSDEFMLGRDILVAPVLEPGVTQRRLYLPKGNWIHPWTGTKYMLDEGRWLNIKAPLGEPAVFINSDSVWNLFLNKLSSITN